MSILSRPESGSPPRVVADTGAAADFAGLESRYLTDGINLYRCLGRIGSGRGEMIGLEDCSSLELMLLPMRELRARRLRAVIPASGE